ncbi:MAG: lysozyme inhibitor LprI family protein [Thiolinea sp.]
MKKIAVAFVLVMVVSPVAQAMMALNCSEAASLDDQQLGDCVGQETGIMEDTLSQLGKTYTHLSWDKIQESQSAWKNYMGANCAFHELNAGGGGADVRALNECKVRMLFERNRELEFMSAQ